MKKLLLPILAFAVGACAPLSAEPTDHDHADGETPHAHTTEIQPTLAATAESKATSAVAAQTATVDIKLFGFQPAVLEVHVGTTVTWTNRDDIEHSITSGAPPEADGSFDSGFFAQDGTYSYTFNTPGEYAYFCQRHNSMTGLVRVVP